MRCGFQYSLYWHVLISGRVPGRSSHLLKVSATSQEGLVDDQVFFTHEPLGVLHIQNL